MRELYDEMQKNNCLILTLFGNRNKCPNLQTGRKPHYLVLFGADLPYFVDEIWISLMDLFNKEL